MGCRSQPPFVWIFTRHRTKKPTEDCLSPRKTTTIISVFSHKWWKRRGIKAPPFFWGLHWTQGTGSFQASKAEKPDNSALLYGGISEKPCFHSKKYAAPPPDLGKGSARARNGNFFSRRLYYYDTEQKENQAILALAGGQTLQRWLLPIPKALEAIPIPNKPSVSPRRHPCTKKAPPYPILAGKNLREPSRRTAVFL